MRLNIFKRRPVLTAEGAPAVPNLSPEQQLRRCVMSCLLWDDAFYLDGKAIADLIVENAAKVKPATLAAMAIEAREQANLRHAPLLLLDVLSKTGAGDPIVSETVARVIQRPDEMGELLAVFWRNGRKMVPAGMRKGLARAFAKFDEYQLAKYDRNGAVKLRDVLRLVRPTPEDEVRSALWKRVKDRQLAKPDTWEVELSAGKDKKETFERLLREGKLGYLALLRNLRNMVQAECDRGLVREAILARKGAQRVLPFRYVAAARAAPRFEPELDRAMIAAMVQMPKLPGKTILLVDVSGSMGYGRLSRKSDMTRLDAAGALAAIVVGQCEQPVVYATAGNNSTRIHKTTILPPRHGMAMVDAVKDALSKLGGGGIFLVQALDYLRKNEKKADRIIVISDEQDCDTDPAKKPANADAFGVRNYLVNISVEKNGIGYKPKFVHIDGFSESVIRFIAAIEGNGA